MKKILLIEDNSIIIKGLKFSFEDEGYYFNYKESYEEAISEINGDYDLIILDITLPDGSGLDLGYKIKEIPIIFLTANDDEDVILKGLEISEDYITKPFRVNELMLRVKKILNRTDKSFINIKDIKMDKNKYKVFKNGKDIYLTSLEFELLKVLFENKNKVLTRKILLQVLDKNNNFVEDNTLSVYIKRLREKIGKEIIKTVKNIGYIVEDT